MHRVSFWAGDTVKLAIRASFLKLTPQYQLRNPIMFTVYIASLLTTALFIQSLWGQGDAATSFIFAITLWLWFTLIFANFAESMAEGRGKAQAEALRRARHEIQAKN